MDDELERLLLAGDNEAYLKALHEALADVRTEECGEPLVPLANGLHEKIIINLVPLAVPCDDRNRLWLRSGVLEKLNAAQEALPDGYRLMIRDAFRTKETVDGLFAAYVAQRLRETNCAREEAELFVRTLLATADGPVTPGHMTGGAADVVLAYGNGERVNMELPRDAMPRHEQSFTWCPGLPDELIQKRRILHAALAGAGFHNYSREYWHYSYGDAYWAVRRQEKTAIYGVAHLPK